MTSHAAIGCPRPGDHEQRRAQARRPLRRSALFLLPLLAMKLVQAPMALADDGTNAPPASTSTNAPPASTNSVPATTNAPAMSAMTNAPAP